MANSKGRCAGCNTYHPIENLRPVGLVKFCSEECRAKIVAQNRSKQKKAGQRKRTKRGNSSTLSPDVRNKIRKRDGSVCRFCQKTAYRMECHHITYRSQGGTHSVTNLITLCEEHHKLVHSNKRHWQPTLRAVIWAHYVEGRFYTVPEMEARLIKEGLLDPLDTA